MDSQDVEKTSIQLGIAFIVGVVVGAVAMLFLAPRSGKELRTDIHGNALRLRDQAQIERDRMQVHLDEMNAKLDDMKQQVKSMGHHSEDGTIDATDSVAYVSATSE